MARRFGNGSYTPGSGDQRPRQSGGGASGVSWKPRHGQAAVPLCRGRRLTREGDTAVSVAAASRRIPKLTSGWCVTIRARRTSPIGAGENSGVTIAHKNVVRAIWSGWADGRAGRSSYAIPAGGDPAWRTRYSGAEPRMAARSWRRSSFSDAERATASATFIPSTAGRQECRRHSPRLRRPDKVPGVLGLWIILPALERGWARTCASPPQSAPHRRGQNRGSACRTPATLRVWRRWHSPADMMPGRSASRRGDRTARHRPACVDGNTRDEITHQLRRRMA